MATELIDLIKGLEANVAALSFGWAIAQTVSALQHVK